jgi:hypothetical protein
MSELLEFSGWNLFFLKIYLLNIGILIKMWKLIFIWKNIFNEKNKVNLGKD